ncbi:hypothetical protein R3P38DRAFT_2777445 [Favolaschia claudopus]|uniref:Uncharacterized protein n=1 Tax=Favolaschia claudopus TaxID=2862362 RepID=A0AAW0BJB9_9AGAR
MLNYLRRVLLFQQHNFLLQYDPYLESQGGIYALEENVVDPHTGVWLGTRVKFGSTKNLRRRQGGYKFCPRLRWVYFWVSDRIRVTEVNRGHYSLSTPAAWVTRPAIRVQLRAKAPKLPDKASSGNCASGHFAANNSNLQVNRSESLAPFCFGGEITVPAYSSISL